MNEFFWTFSCQKGINMGLFSVNYNKPGPGVSKNGPQKHRFWQFFEIYWGQFSKLCLLNILYLIASIPLMLGLYLCFKIDVTSSTLIVLRTPGSIDILGLGLIVLSVFTTFPATLGFTFVLRNIQRREHAWIWHDFMKHTRSNYKKGVINGALVLLLYYFLINAYGIYRANILGIGLLNIYLSWVIFIMIILFTWMEFYVNTMIVTFDMKLKDIYKNSFIFAVAKLPLNLFISIVCLALLLGIYLIPIPLITLIIFFVMFFSLFGFITVFSVYPTIDKHMISQVEKAEEEEVTSEFSDDLRTDIKEDRDF